MNRNFFIFGFALFSMFFGAGNLIIPPILGKQVGSFWITGSIGFFLTGIGLPLLGVFSFTKIKSIEHFADKVSIKFNTLFLSILILVIGPLCAIPRTGSVTFEMGILPFFNNPQNSISYYLLSTFVSFVFFGITYALVLNESKVIDILGKILTPVILIMLALLVIFAVNYILTNNLVVNIPNNSFSKAFSTGFTTGYQTMDALGSTLMGVIILKTLISKGINDERQQKNYIIGSGIISAICLGIVYISLIYIGASLPQLQNSKLSTSEVTLYIAKLVLGDFGQLSIGICVAAACLTTSVGLVALASDWFSKLLNVSYKKVSFFISLFSALISIIGLDGILKLAVPILILLYPITIVIILLNIFEVKSSFVFKSTVYSTCFASLILSSFQILNIKLNLYLPQDFIWIYPAIIIFLLTTLIQNVKKINTKN